MHIFYPKGKRRVLSFLDRRRHYIQQSSLSSWFSILSFRNFPSWLSHILFGCQNRCTGVQHMKRKSHYGCSIKARYLLFGRCLCSPLTNDAILSLALSSFSLHSLSHHFPPNLPSCLSLVAVLILAPDNKTLTPTIYSRSWKDRPHPAMLAHPISCRAQDQITRNKSLPDRTRQITFPFRVSKARYTGSRVGKIPASLQQSKGRPEKPFQLLYHDLLTLPDICHLGSHPITLSPRPDPVIVVADGYGYPTREKICPQPKDQAGDRLYDTGFPILEKVSFGKSIPRIDLH